MVSAATTAPISAPAAWEMYWFLGEVPSTCPAWKSFITSPTRPQATAMTAATKNMDMTGISFRAAASSMTMRPKTSMGSMPVWPTQMMAMTAATQTSTMMTRLVTTDSLKARHMRNASTVAARTTMRATFGLAMPSAKLVREAALEAPSDAAFLRSRSMKTLATTARPPPIMRPMPRLDLMA